MPLQCCSCECRHRRSLVTGFVCAPRCGCSERGIGCSPSPCWRYRPFCCWLLGSWQRRGGWPPECQSELRRSETVRKRDGAKFVRLFLTDELAGAEDVGERQAPVAGSHHGAYLHVTHPMLYLHPVALAVAVSLQKQV